MKSVIDANVLMQVLGVIGNGLTCPKTGVLIDKIENRAEAFLDNFSKSGCSLIVPAPVLAEVLVKVEIDKRIEYVNAINSITSISILPFDQKSSIECARLFNAEEAKQLRKEGELKSKIAVDRQVIAIALANGAVELWTHDKKVYRKAKKVGLIAKSLADIEPIPMQEAMKFEEASV